MSGKLTSMLSKIDTSSIADVSKDSENSAVSNDSPRIFPIYICINEYSKRMEDELDMKPGDKIQVITDDREYNDGWYFGLNLRTKEEGLYPVVFTQEISTERKPTLMRAKSLKRMNSVTGLSDSNHSLVQSTADSSTDNVVGHSTNVGIPVDVHADAEGNRHVSVKSTMSDIDRALQDFQISDEELNSHKMENEGRVNSPEHSLANETIFSETTDLNVSEAPLKTQTHATETPSRAALASSSLDDINGKRDLNVLNARNWTPEEVTEYFIQAGFDVESASRFKQHKISGKILFELELSHLKELDVNSFGTRFEMFKEISALKEASEMASDSSRQHGRALMPAAEVEQPFSKGQSQTISQSVDELAMRKENAMVTPQNRQSSVFINGKATTERDGQTVLSSPMDSKVTDPEIFASPRRAPKPPSYPSPAQPPKSPMVNRLASPLHAEDRSSQSPYHNIASHDSSEHLSGTPTSRTPYQRATRSGAFSPYSSRAIKEESDIADKRSSVIYSPPGETEETEVPKATLTSDESHEQEVVGSRDIPGGENQDESNKKDLLKPDDDDDSSSDRPTSSIYATSSDHSMADDNVIINAGKNESSKRKSSVPKRSSSILSYLTPSKETPADRSLSVNTDVTKSNSLKVKKKGSSITSPFRQQFTENAGRASPTSPLAGESAIASPIEPPKTSKPVNDKRRSVSARETHPDDTVKDIMGDEHGKRSVSEAVKPKKLHALKTKAPLKKQTTSAFMEGLRNISVEDAMKTADYSGWMSKKGSGTMSTWKNRFFTLHGTRLSYFSSTADTRERGLIDITAHRVVPAREDDRFVSLYAASTGKGRYCFKLIPPAPGSKKGLTFTQPKIHYFAVDTKEEMRGWMATLIKTTIDIDKSVPVISSYSTPTVSLKKAKMLLADAREETRLREESLQADGEDAGQALWEEQQQKSSSHNKHKHSVAKKGDKSSDKSRDTPSLSINTSNVSTGNITTGSSGFASPYLLASGVLSPQLPNSPGFRKTESKEKKDADYFGSSTNLNDGGKL